MSTRRFAERNQDEVITHVEDRRQRVALRCSARVSYSATNSSAALVVVTPVWEGWALVLWLRRKDCEKQIQELHAKEVGVGNPSEERANS